MTELWTVNPEQIWSKPRTPGISGFMRLKNEADFLDKAIETHLAALDELILVHNDCSDDTPEICARWQRRSPEKIKVFEYEPKVVPWGTPESLVLETTSPHAYANYCNFALGKTSRQIAIKLDGDHIAVTPRLVRICSYVRRKLPYNFHYPLYGLNITADQGQIGIYNFYNYSAEYPIEVNLHRVPKLGPPPFTSGDHRFFYVDHKSYFTVDPLEGYDTMDMRERPRLGCAPFTYSFFHMKGMKLDRGLSNLNVTEVGEAHGRAAWAANVLAPDPQHLATIEAMRRHNGQYFRGVDVYRELKEAFPDMSVRQPLSGEKLPPITLHERLAHLWYRVAYP